MLAAFGTTLNLASLWASKNSCSSVVVCRRLRRTLTSLIFPFGLDIWSINFVKNDILPKSCIFSQLANFQVYVNLITSRSNSLRRILAPVFVGNLTSNGIFCLTVADSIATPDSKSTSGTTTNMVNCILLNLLGNTRSKKTEPSFYIIISSVQNNLYLLYVSEIVRHCIDFCKISSYYKQINFILNEALIKMSDTSPAVQFSKWLFSCLKFILWKGEG